jgi:hypothetical protein
MKKRHAVSALFILVPSLAAAQMHVGNIRVEPEVVSVSSQDATTAILTFSGLEGYAPAEGLWCGRVVVASERGARCDPATLFGQTLGGSSQKVSSGGVFTDIMSVPESVAQRAYAAALAGESSRFFYVRHFVGSSLAGAFDQYVAVSLLLTGGGASTPFALTDVRLHLESEVPVVFVRSGERPPPLVAEISYTGTGRLRGRWEVVLPGEEMPSRYDLLTEGSLPAVERGLQRRYREVERFNVLFLPNGRFTLPGPDPARLPTSTEGTYTILLRIEVSDDGLSSVRYGDLAGGQTVIQNGAAAGFPMPTLRYIVGSSRTRSFPTTHSVRLRLPGPDALVSPDSALTLSWADEPDVGRYRVEMEAMTDGSNVLSAFVARGVGAYDVPPFVLGQVPDGKVRWRVVALDAGGREIGRSEWRSAQRWPQS